MSTTSHEWILSGVEPATASAYLQRHAPWRMNLKFKDGPSAEEFEIYQPFNRSPLFKLNHILPHVADGLQGARVLDVGANRGHNALHLAANYGAKVTASDVIREHREAMTELADILGVELECVKENAEEIDRPEAFDLVIHFGVLYHLKNPVRALEVALDAVRPGGWFALETMQYAGEDPRLCKWITDLPGSNFWAVGPALVEEVLAQKGASDVRKLREGKPPQFNGEFVRPIWLARKS